MMNMMTLPPMIFLVGVVPLEKAFGSDIVQMIVNAGPMVKFVLLILLFFSILSWAIIFMKWSLFRKAKQETIFFLDLFWQSRGLDDIFQECDNLRYSPVVHVFKSGYSEIRRVSKINNRPTTDEGNKGEQTFMGNMERTLKRAALDQSNRLEKALSFLATTGNTAPFIGLFGTVWGIMEAFRGIGLKGSANLAVVAPGISEALIATAAGLAAAIPAVVAFNYFNNRVMVLRSEMDAFVSDFMSLFEGQLFKKRMGLEQR
jgi:biopolymer transport protein TolQ